MPVLNTDNQVTISGNDVTTEVPFPFLVFADTDVEVVLINAGAETPQTQGVDYTLTRNTPLSGGTVTFTVAPPTGTDAQVRRAVPLTQPASFDEFAVFPASTIQRVVDRLTVQLQQIQAEIDRVLLVDPLEAADDQQSLTVPIPEDGKILVGKADGTGFTNSTLADLGDPATITLPLAIGEGGTGASAAGAARTNLGLGTAAVLDTGVTNGDVLAVGPGDLIDRDVLPLYGEDEDGAVPGFTSAETGRVLGTGGWVSLAGTELLGTNTTSATDTVLAVDGDSTWDAFDEIFFVIRNVFHEATTADMEIQIKQGSSFVTSNSYIFSGRAARSTATDDLNASASSPEDGVRVAGANEGPITTARAWDGKVTILQAPSDRPPSGDWSMFMIDSTSAQETWSRGMFRMSSNGPVRGVRVLCVDGTFEAGGTIAAFGVRYAT